MSEEAELKALREDNRELHKKIDRLMVLIQGDPWDENNVGIVGRLNRISDALWGPPGHPNGVIGMVKEGRVIWRTIAVGLVVAVGSGIANKVGLF